jgi:hypothetical protein
VRKRRGRKGENVGGGINAAEVSVEPPHLLILHEDDLQEAARQSGVGAECVLARADDQVAVHMDSGGVENVNRNGTGRFH